MRLPTVPDAWQTAVIERLRHHQEQVAAHFQQDFSLPSVHYDIRGANAGMAKLQSWQIRLNPVMLLAQPEAYIAQVPGHEWAHLVTHKLYGKVKPHGQEWRQVMAVLKLDARVTHAFAYQKARQERTVTYQCGCPEPNNHHQLGIRRHNKVHRQQATYQCRLCGSTLKKINKS